jgi:hypothetical protein
MDEKITFVLERLANSKFKNNLEAYVNERLNQLDLQKQDIGYQEIKDSFILLIKIIESNVSQVRKRYSFKKIKKRIPAHIQKKSKTFYKYVPTHITTKNKIHVQFKNLLNQFKYKYIIKVKNEVIQIAETVFKIPKSNLLSYTK